MQCTFCQFIYGHSHDTATRFSIFVVAGLLHGTAYRAAPYHAAPSRKPAFADTRRPYTHQDLPHTLYAHTLRTHCRGARRAARSISHPRAPRQMFRTILCLALPTSPVYLWFRTFILLWFSYLFVVLLNYSIRTRKSNAGQNIQ